MSRWSILTSNHLHVLARRDARRKFLRLRSTDSNLHSLDSGCFVASPGEYWAYGIHPLFQCPRAWTVDWVSGSHYGIRSCVHELHPLSHCPRGGGLKFEIQNSNSKKLRRQFRIWIHHSDPPSTRPRPSHLPPLLQPTLVLTSH